MERLTHARSIVAHRRGGARRKKATHQAVICCVRSDETLLDTLITMCVPDKVSFETMQTPALVDVNMALTSMARHVWVKS